MSVPPRLPPPAPRSVFNHFTRQWYQDLRFLPNRHSGGAHCHNGGAGKRCMQGERVVDWDWAATAFTQTSQAQCDNWCGAAVAGAAGAGV